VFGAVAEAGNIVCHTKTPVSLQYCLFAHFVAGGNWGPLINTPAEGYLFKRRCQGGVGNGLGQNGVV
jgi:hypothetical protein